MTAPDLGLNKRRSIRDGAVGSVIALDLLRGVAALTVLIVHTRGASFVEFGALPAYQQTYPLAILFGVSRLGQEAVLLFFVLSGFLVGGQIVSRLREGSFRLADYAADRCSRILLPLIPACVLTALANAVLLGRPDHLGNIVGSMVGLNGVLVSGLSNNAPLWTLSYEIWFYVIGGAVGTIVACRRPSPPVGVLCVVCLGAAVFSILEARYFIYWGLGALMVFGLRTRCKNPLALAGGVTALAGMLLHQLAVTSKSFQNVALVPAEVSEAMLVIGVCLALPALCDGGFDRRIEKLRRFARAIGAFSFSLYLIHYPVLTVLGTYLPKEPGIGVRSVTYFVLRVVICLAIATAFYWMFERRTYAVRRLIKSKWGAPAPVALRVPQE